MRVLLKRASLLWLMTPYVSSNCSEWKDLENLYNPNIRCDCVIRRLRDSSFNRGSTLAFLRVRVFLIR